MTGKKTRKPNRRYTVFIPCKTCVPEDYKKYSDAIESYFKNVSEYLKNDNKEIDIVRFKYKQKDQCPVSNLRSNGVPDKQFIILDGDAFITDFQRVITSTGSNYLEVNRVISNGSFLIWILLHKCSNNKNEFKNSEDYRKWINSNGWNADDLSNNGIEINKKSLSNAKKHGENLIKLNSDNSIHPYTDAHKSIDIILK